MVHQHFMLIPVMTVAENIVLATEPVHNGVLLDYDVAAKRVQDISTRFGLAVDPRAMVQDITVGQQQRVEILKALYRGADILVLDEPTAVLTPQEAQELFAIVRSLTEQGKSIIFISHKLNEVTEIADRITVLRRGKKIETLPAAGATEEGLARLMVGREVLLRVEKRPGEPKEPLLRIEGLTVDDDRGLEKVHDVSFEVRGGEIVGHRRRRRQRPDRADRRHRRPPQGEGRADRRRGRGRHRTMAAATASTRGSATFRKTGSAAGSCSTSRSPRTSPSTTTTISPPHASAGSSRSVSTEKARAC